MCSTGAGTLVDCIASVDLVLEQKGNVLYQ